MPARMLSVVAGKAACGLLAACAAVGVGCSRPATSAPSAPLGTVAVIDLDRVAQKLGQDRQITQAIQTQQSLLQKQLQELAAAYDQQLAQNRQNSAEPSTGEVALASWQQQASANLGKARQELEAKLTAHRAQLVLQFREQIKPFAREAARARGLSVIVTKNESVVYDFVDAVDISDDVVTAIRDSDAAQPLVSADVPQIARQPEAVQQR